MNKINYVNVKTSTTKNCFVLDLVDAEHGKIVKTLTIPIIKSDIDQAEERLFNLADQWLLDRGLEYA